MVKAPFKNLRELRSLTRFDDAESQSSQTSVPPHDVIWALRDVSFDVEQGDVIGIVGRNGAGKSTFLKILSRITEPTSGTIRLRGRVSSLLEVGTGFHSELTGRENIYLNGTILGMRKQEIDRKFDEIVAFSEIETFLDTPVKRYSSGMYVRLAFAVAAHLEPEILVVDEVLAVGDINFQKKCLGKMGDVARQGRTVLFVSHNMIAIQRLCEKAIWLDRGVLVKSGGANDVVTQYIKGGDDYLNGRVWFRQTPAPSNEKAFLKSIKLLTSSNQIAEIVDIKDPVIVEIEYAVQKADTLLNLSLSLYTPDDIHVFTSASINDPNGSPRNHHIGLYQSTCIIPSHLLNQGHYIMSIVLVEYGHRIIEQADRVVSIDMIDSGSQRGHNFGHWGGIVQPRLEWTTDFVGNSSRT
ncbi:MAG: ABC transporter ATP-binding protein [Syntrophaceae bacterium]